MTTRSTRRTAKLTKRTIVVLNRYTVKQDCPEKDLHTGDVVLHIRNDQGTEYYTTLRRQTKQHSCTCPSRKPCYHINRMVVAENARWQAEKTEQAKAVEEAAKIVELAVIRQAKEAAKGPAKSAEQIREEAPLTRNSGFSLMR